jgi:hypothetical protein
LLLFSSGVQRIVLVYLLNTKSYGKVTIEQVSWKGESIELQGVCWEEKNFDLEINQLQVDWDWSQIFEDVVELELVDAKGVELYLEGPEVIDRSSPDGVSILAGGVWGLQKLSEVSLPVYCKSISGGGRIVYNASKINEQSTLFTVEGGNFRPGESGQLDLKTRMQGVSWRAEGDEFAAIITMSLDVNSFGRIYGGQLTVAGMGKEIFKTSMESVDGIVSGNIFLDMVESNVFWEVPYGALFHSGVLKGEYLLRSEPSGEFDVNGSVRVEQIQTIPVEYQANLIKVDALIKGRIGERLELAMPFVVEREGTSSMASIEGEVLLNDENLVFDLGIKGGPMMAEDVGVLLALGSLGRDRGDGVAVSGITRERPSWSGKSGSVKFDLKEVSIEGLSAVPNISGLLSLSEEEVVLSEVELSSGEDKLRAQATLAFRSYERFPYVLNGEVDVLRLHAEDWLVNPQRERKAVLEGIFYGKGIFSSVATDTVFLGDEIQGNLTLKGDSGFFRGLDGKVGRVERVAGLLGSLIRSPKLDAIAAFSSSLAEIPYDEMSLVMKRDASKVMFLDDFFLQSPEILLRGRGRVGYEKGLPWDEQPLKARFHMGGKGRLKDLLESLDLLDSGRVVSGYSLMKDSFEITGTLASPDSKNLRKVLQKAAGSIWEDAFSSNNGQK